MVNRDFDALAKLYSTLGFIPPDQDLAPITAALHDALPDVLNASVSELNIKSVIEKLGDVMYSYPFALPPYYTALLRCLGVLEGLALQVWPRPRMRLCRCHRARAPPSHRGTEAPRHGHGRGRSLARSQVDEDFTIIKDAYPFVAARLLTERSPQLQRALSALLFREGALRWDFLEELLTAAAQTSEYDLLAVVEQLADYMLSEEGAPLQGALASQLVDELDTLGADSAGYLYRSLVGLASAISARLVADASDGGRGSAAAGARAPSGEGLSGEGASGGYADGDRGGVAGGRLSLITSLAAVMEVISAQLADAPPPSAAMQRAMRVIDLIEKSVRGGQLDLPRLGTLTVSILSQERVQRQITNVSLALVERGVTRGLRAVFSTVATWTDGTYRTPTPPQAERSPPTQSPPASAHTPPPPSKVGSQVAGTSAAGQGRAAVGRRSAVHAKRGDTFAEGGLRARPLDAAEITAPAAAAKPPPAATATPPVVTTAPPAAAKPPPAEGLASGGARGEEVQLEAMGAEAERTSEDVVASDVAAAASKVAPSTVPEQREAEMSAAAKPAPRWTEVEDNAGAAASEVADDALLARIEGTLKGKWPVGRLTRRQRRRLRQTFAAHNPPRE